MRFLFVLLITAVPAVALADRGPRVRDHRGGGAGFMNHRGGATFGNNTFHPGGAAPRAYQMRSDGRFYLPGATIGYRRPTIVYRYRDYARRPSPVMESYQTVPGYVWVPGQWTWTGYEWSWTPGYYATDPNYYPSGYGSSGYAPTSPGYSSLSPSYVDPNYPSAGMTYGGAGTMSCAPDCTDPNHGHQF